MSILTKVFVLVALLAAIPAWAETPPSVWSVHDVGTEAWGNESTSPEPEPMVGRPSDEELIQLLRRPVLETLAGVEYVRLDDQNFKREVLENDTHVMVLFYSDDPATPGKNNSRGMAALAFALKRIYPQYKLGVYQASATDSLPSEELRRLAALYQIQMVPSLEFYRYFSYEHVVDKLNFGLDNGIIWNQDLLYQVDRYSRVLMPRQLDNVWE
ncbi:MAG: hypothetical protein KKB70_11170 [Proteobacteria bacterium]|nr:hypothetical protein [Pseudomonadota bacterium]MBU1610617.1 hypothetical protein [Pseudomonadota bacterium]